MSQQDRLLNTLAALTQQDLEDFASYLPASERAGLVARVEAHRNR
jgi:hypothetical protein